MATAIPDEMVYSIIEHSYDGIFITDGNAKVLMANKAYESITGLKVEQLLGKSMQDLVQSKMVSESGSLMVLHTGGPVTLHQEFATGKRALVTSSPIFDKEHKIAMIVTNVRDMTEIYRLEAQAEQASEERVKIRRELEILQNELLTPDLIAESPITLHALQLAEKVSKLDTLVILLGETGVGKEVFARYIHSKSTRGEKPFVKVNCGAIPENLIESELFGYEGGAFTGADRRGKPGLFEVADKGTIFLDEIAELSLMMQVKLLRVLQEKEFTKVGGTVPVQVDVRVIAATNRSLEKMVQEGKFREDLYYRLMVFPLQIPPLRQRIGDIKPLAEFFLGRLNKKYGFQKTFTYEAMVLMEEYLWPGNIRELKNVIEHAVIISSDDSIEADELPIYQKRTGEKEIYRKYISNLPAYLHEIELKYINEAYEKYGSVRKAAKSLGISPATFVRKRAEKNESQV